MKFSWADLLRRVPWDRSSNPTHHGLGERPAFLWAGSFRRMWRTKILVSLCSPICFPNHRHPDVVLTHAITTTQKYLPQSSNNEIWLTYCFRLGMILNCVVKRWIWIEEWLKTVCRGNFNITHGPWTRSALVRAPLQLFKKMFLCWVARKLHMMARNAGTRATVWSYI